MMDMHSAMTDATLIWLKTRSTSKPKPTAVPRIEYNLRLFITAVRILLHGVKSPAAQYSDVSGRSTTTAIKQYLFMQTTYTRKDRTRRRKRERKREREFDTTNDKTQRRLNEGFFFPQFSAVHSYPAHTFLTL